METIKQRRRGIGPSDAGCGLDPRQAGNGQGGPELIVDDDAAVRLVCAANLEAEGLHVLEAADGLDALEPARCRRPDLVLTDVTMPGLDCFQLAARFREIPPGRANPLDPIDLPDWRNRAGERGAPPCARGARVPGKSLRPAHSQRSSRTNSRRREPVPLSSQPRPQKQALVDPT